MRDETTLKFLCGRADALEEASWGSLSLFGMLAKAIFRVFSS
jgi:hypothetical protein